MNGRITEKAYSKLNLSLDVLGKRDDGFHEMLMVMQSISLSDDIAITARDGQGSVSVKTNRSFLPVNEKNLAFSAAKLFLDSLNIKDTDVHIDLKKNVPVCAGMGGGSSDAAAVLRGMNALFGKPLGASELMELAAKCGSDVPFCVTGGTMLASGRGTDFKPLTAIPDCAFVVVKPSFSVRTPDLFRAIDDVKLRVRPDTEGLVAAIADGDLMGISRRVFDVFESVLPQPRRETVERAKADLIDAGAFGASMTGTGSAVFGVFSDYDAASSAKNALRATWKEIYAARPVSRIDV